MWFEAEVVAMLGYGLLDFLFKVAESRAMDFSNLFLYYYWTAAILAFAGFALFPEPIDNFAFIAFFALAQISLFLVSNALKLESLRHIKSVLAYPIFSLNGVAAAIMVFVFLGESLGALQYLGIVASVVAILLLIERGRHLTLSKGALLAIGAMLFLAASGAVLAAIIDKIVFLPFMGLAYFFAIGPAFVLEKNLHKRGGRKKGVARLGFLMGVTNFSAFYLMIYALSRGPASAIFPIIGLALVVSILFSMAFYKERLARKKWLAVALAMAAIILMRV